jgi:plastocyanin
MIPLRRLSTVAGALAIAACAPCPQPQSQPAITTDWATATAVTGRPRVRPADSVRVVQVQMRTTQGGASGEFVPRVVRARPGDLVRFQIENGMAVHNVSFKWQGDRRDASLPPDSPMLVEQGQTWQLRVDLPPGTYEFACIPHLPMGMRGTLIVEE